MKIILLFILYKNIAFKNIKDLIQTIWKQALMKVIVWNAC